MKKLLTTILALFIFFAFLNADIYIKQESHTDAVEIMGQKQPAKDEISETWIGDQWFANHGKERSTIMDLKNNLMYMINHKNKNYIEMTLPLNMSKYLPQQMAQMMESMMNSTKISVNPSGEKKKIGNWGCDGYDVSMSIMMMQMNMKIWATTDVPFDWKKVGENIMTNFFKAQLRLSDSAIKEFLKIKGYWIATETTMNMMGATIKSNTRVIEITEKTPDASVYSVPAGYKKQEKLSMKDLQGK